MRPKNTLFCLIVMCVSWSKCALLLFLVVSLTYANQLRPRLSSDRSVSSPEQLAPTVVVLSHVNIGGFATGFNHFFTTPIALGHANQSIHFNAAMSRELYYLPATSRSDNNGRFSSSSDRTNNIVMLRGSAAGANLGLLQFITTNLGTNQTLIGDPTLAPLCNILPGLDAYFQDVFHVNYSDQWFAIDFQNIYIGETPNVQGESYRLGKVGKTKRSVYTAGQETAWIVSIAVYADITDLTPLGLIPPPVLFVCRKPLRETRQ